VIARALPAVTASICASLSCIRGPAFAVATRANIDTPANAANAFFIRILGRNRNQLRLCPSTKWGTRETAAFTAGHPALCAGCPDACQAVGDGIFSLLAIGCRHKETRLR
jgi:hypothetical protein